MENAYPVKKIVFIVSKIIKLVNFVKLVIILTKQQRCVPKLLLIIVFQWTKIVNVVFAKIIIFLKIMNAKYVHLNLQIVSIVLII